MGANANLVGKPLSGFPWGAAASRQDRRKAICTHTPSSGTTHYAHCLRNARVVFPQRLLIGCRFAARMQLITEQYAFVERIL